MNLTYITQKIFAKKPSILQGFGLSFGLGMTYFSLLVIIPLIALFAFSFKLEWAKFVEIISDSQVLSALKFSLSTALIGFCISICAGYRRVWRGGGGERENHRANYHDAFIY